MAPWLVLEVGELCVLWSLAPAGGGVPVVLWLVVPAGGFCVAFCSVMLSGGWVVLCPVLPVAAWLPLPTLVFGVSLVTPGVVVAGVWPAAEVCPAGPVVVWPAAALSPAAAPIAGWAVLVEVELVALLWSVPVAEDWEDCPLEEQESATFSMDSTAIAPFTVSVPWIWTCCPLWGISLLSAAFTG